MAERPDPTLLPVALERAVDAAVEALKQPGAVILYPTETLYGIGGLASDSRSAERVARLKARTRLPLLVIAENPPLEWLIAQQLAAAFWPGPLSLIVPAWEGLAPEILAPDGTVGVRRSPHEVVRALVRRVGPLTSTSANRSGEEPALDPSRVHFVVDAVIDMGPLPQRSPSTIVRGDTGEILREGAISRGAIARVLAGRA
jgi:L-threonylcarbamoyladenylate synthase